MRDKVIGFKLRLKTALAIVADAAVAVKSAVADVAVATVGVTLATVALGVMLMASGCARGAKSGNAKYVIVTLRGPSSMGMVHLMDSLEKASHNPFEIQIVSEPMQARKMMIDGTADFAVLPTTMGAAMYTKGLGYRLVAVPVWGSLYLFGNDGGIGSIRDLKGRRIYVMAKGMTPDLLLRYLLKQNGIDPDKDVTLDYSFPTHIDLANAVAAGRAEIGVVSEPYVSMVIQKNPKVRAIIDLSAEWDKVQGVPIAETALLGKSSVLLGNPKMVEKLIAMYKSSSNWVNANPDSAARLIVRYGILQDTTAARMAIPRSNLRVEAAESIEQSVNDYLKVFYDMNPEAVGGKMPDKDFFYYSDETTLNR